jgi:hypothetical protein
VPWLITSNRLCGNSKAKGTAWKVLVSGSLEKALAIKPFFNQGLVFSEISLM